MAPIEEISWALRIASGYSITVGIPYGALDDPCAKVDLYDPLSATSQRPALMFVHAGAWRPGTTKEMWTLWFLPFLQLGWVVFNVEYRPANVSRAPAALEDCLLALHWIGNHTQSLRVDRRKLVIAGVSAGGLLALTTAFIASKQNGASRSASCIVGGAGIATPADLLCPAAVINWCGITDVTALMRGPGRQDYVMEWLGDTPHSAAIATAVSPLTYVSPSVPPVITIHGKRDDIVPHSQAELLHAALAKVRAVNELVTIEEAGHAMDLDALVQSYPRILRFLEQAGIDVQSTACLPPTPDGGRDLSAP